MSTQETIGGPEAYRKIAKIQRTVLAEAVKRESVTKQRRILADYDKLISNNIKVLSQEKMFENWEAYCFYSNPQDLLSEETEESSDVILNERVSQQAVDFFTGGLKSQAIYLNTVEDYLDKVIDAVGPQAESFPTLQSGLQKAKGEVEKVSTELEEFFQKSSGGKGFLRKLTTMPQRFLSRLGAGSTKDNQLFESLVSKSLVNRTGYIGLVMSMLDESFISEALSDSNVLLTEAADPVSIATGMSSMGQIVGEIGKLSARHGGRLLTNVDISSLVRAHPDIQRSTLENIVHLMGKNAQNVAGNPSAITPDLFQSVGRAMGWLPNNAAGMPAPPVPGVTPVPGVPDGGGSFLTWLHNLWIKAMTFAKGVYAKMYAYLAPKLLALKAWLATTFKGGVAAAKGLLGKAGSWLSSKMAAVKGGLAAKGGLAGLAGKGLAGLKAGVAGLGAAAASPGAAGLAALGGAAVAGKSLYSLMSRRKNLENVFDFVKSLKNISGGSLKESLVSESTILSELFEADEAKVAALSSSGNEDMKQKVKLYAATLKKYVDVNQLANELSTPEGLKLLQRIKAIPTPKVPTERYS